MLVSYYLWGHEADRASPLLDALVISQHTRVAKVTDLDSWLESSIAKENVCMF